MMDRFNGIAAMAAHALGYSGTDYDVAVVRERGYDPSFLAQAARSLLADYKDVIYFVAARIQAKGTISGYEAKTIMEYASRPRGAVRLHPYLQPIHPR